MSIKKNGIITSPNIYESSGTNIFLNSEKYTREHPYIVSGSSGDIYVITDMYAEVVPKQTYYLISNTDSTWSSQHVGEPAWNKVTIWLYLLKTYEPEQMGYNSPVLFVSSEMIRNGVWKYTIPDGFHMARVRFNTYSNGNDTVTAKFWDTMLIPEKYYVPETFEGGSTSSLHIGKDYISAGEIYEI